MTIQTVTDAIRYVGVDDNTLALFENQYQIGRASCRERV